MTRFLLSAALFSMTLPAFGQQTISGGILRAGTVPQVALGTTGAASPSTWLRGDYAWSPLPDATSSQPGLLQLAGDLTGTYAAPSLIAVGTAGTYGDATHYPVITTDGKGRVTAVTVQAAGGGSGDHKVANSSGDTAPGYLSAKLTAGTNITLTTLGSGGSETTQNLGVRGRRDVHGDRAGGRVRLGDQRQRRDDFRARRDTTGDRPDRHERVARRDGERHPPVRGRAVRETGL